MITLDGLTSIPEETRNQVTTCLDDLLTFINPKGQLAPIISGYNWYTRSSQLNRAITIAHLHETENYKQDMIMDFEKIGYDRNTVQRYIREKGSAFLWDLDFEIADASGVSFPRLKIKDRRTGTFLDLTHFNAPLRQYPQFANAQGLLLGENQGWELDIPFQTKNELLTITNLVLNKSGKYLFDTDGLIIPESEEERTKRKLWAGAYRIPVIIIGEGALQYKEVLPHFIPLTRFVLRQNSNEISFVIHQHLERLQALPHYEKLLHLGFTEEPCLGNNSFVLQYVDESDKYK